MITDAAFLSAASKIGCDEAVVYAIAQTESNGSGFDPEGFLVALFEGHKFHKFTNGLYDKEYPTLSYPKWTREFYGKTWQEEKARLELALSIDRTAAMMSTSWGMFQIMGFNHGVCGFKTVHDFVNRMCIGEDEQLNIFVSYIFGARLDDELKDGRYHDFFRKYNGPLYRENHYDTKFFLALNQRITVRGRALT